MADGTLVTIFLWQIAMMRATRFVARTIYPRHKANSSRRTGFHTLRIAIAKETFTGFLFLNIKRHHAPRASLFAEVTTNAKIFIHTTRPCLRIDGNGALWASIGTGHRAQGADIDDRYLEQQCHPPKSLSWAGMRSSLQAQT